MNKRLVNFVLNTNELPRVKHYKGMPPELTDGQDTRLQLGWPYILIIEQKPDGVFLFRFTKDGVCVGDTWHLSIDDAKRQAAYEYSNLLADWKNVPPNIVDSLAWAVGQTINKDQ
jgi:hypothetical protein